MPGVENPRLEKASVFQTHSTYNLGLLRLEDACTL